MNKLVSLLTLLRDSGDFSVCFRMRDRARESVGRAVVINLVGNWLAIATTVCSSSQRKIALLAESSQYINVLSFAKVYEGSIECLLSFYR